MLIQDPSAYFVPELLVAAKGGGIFTVELDEVVSTLQVGTLKRRIVHSKSEYADETKWRFLGNMGKANDYDLVSNYVDFEKKERVVVVRAWNSWYGTFLEQQLGSRYPSMSATKSYLAKFIFSLAFVGIIIASSKASFTLKDPKVPYTLQTLGVFFASFFLGLWSVVSVAIFLILGGAAGLPVFAPGPSVASPLTESTSAGFLWGFLLMSLVVGLLVSWRGWDRNVYTWFLATCIGWIVTFVPGMAFFASRPGMTWNLAVKYALVPFLPAEAIKFAVISVCIPIIWFATSRLLNPRTAHKVTLWGDVKAFFHPKMVSF